MSISAGKIGFKAQFQLQCRTFLIPWVEKKSAISCLRKKDYSSSSPVRYIPKKSSQSKKLGNSDSEPIKVSKKKDFLEFSETSPSVNSEVSYGGSFVHKSFDLNMKPQFQSQMVSSDVLSDYEEQDVLQPLEDKTKNEDEELSTSQECNIAQKSFNFDMKPQYQNQVLTSNLMLHDVEQDNIMEDPVELAGNDGVLEECDDELAEEDYTLEDHEELSEELSMHQQNRCYEPQNNKTKLDAEKAAVKLLSTRAFTTVELKKKLCGKRFPPNIVDAVINEFQSRGLLNDGLYAEAYCQSRWFSSTWGPRRIKQQLSWKGVSKLDSEKAIQLVFKDGESNDHQELCQGLSKTSMDRLLIQASKQWIRGHDVSKETRKARIIRWLQYRGFTWDVIGFIVKKLESNHQP